MYFNYSWTVNSLKSNWDAGISIKYMFLKFLLVLLKLFLCFSYEGGADSHFSAIKMMILSEIKTENPNAGFGE